MDSIEASDFHELASVSEPRVAPGGERVAYVRTVPEDDEEYEATVYVAPVGGGESRRFTVREGEDAAPRWSPSGDRLAFTSTRGEGDRSQLWVVPADGGEARQVTSVVGGVAAPVWSPDGSRVAFVQQVAPDDREAGRDRWVDEEYEPAEPDPRVVDRTVYRAEGRYLDRKRPQVYVVDVDEAGAVAADEERARAAVTRVTDVEADHFSPTWADAETLYFGRQVPREGEADADDAIRIEIRRCDPAEPGDGELVTRDEGWGGFVRAASDGRVAYFHTPEERSTLQQTEVRVYDPASDETRTPTAGVDRTMAYHSVLEWGADEERLYVTTPDEGSVVLRRFPWDADDGDGAPDPSTVVAGEGMDVDAAHVGRDVLAYTASEWDHPGDVFVSTPGGGEGNRLTRVNADVLDGVAVPQPEALRFESGGHEIQGWLLTPPDADGASPLVVNVHGGPHIMWSDSGTMWHEFQSLASAGYAVFFCNPRGSAGYGAAFMQAIEGDWGDVTGADVLAGVDHVTDSGAVDASNVFLTGGSFGGYLTAWLAATSDRFDATVAQRGVYDLLGFYGSTDIAYHLVEGDFGTDPWDDPAFLWEHSPVAHADDIDAPTLVLHAENDFRVPVDGAEFLFRALRKTGTDTRFVRYPREGHELSRSGEPCHVVDRIERIRRWFDGYSDHHDAPPALGRAPDAGLSAGDDDEPEGN
ncbi:S9 family peptidase [Haloarchaeobius iranensis]|uniref:Dipeptidyl aminopeptidase/acylaminoacyl peptidase n=1 Tax=Haloarchaeobius iranensis TaxID=996166 RepID=A0A1G9SG59_9EURY|nr:S9 family peptidase [Haloarchaeobius iranensis]SDM34391.1 Dipeptidyl aminopeptidase/acylaminoacyl peptidase [Haloarchaeobius iranensis]